MQTIKIQRYSNRKLYNYEMSRHVNVKELKEFIDAGFNLIVVNHDTGEDVTRQTVGELIKQSEGDLTNVYLFMLKRKAV